MALINCPECNKPVSDKAKICPHCGIDLEQEMQPKFTCPECGREITEKSTKCVFCGFPLSEPPLFPERQNGFPVEMVPLPSQSRTTKHISKHSNVVILFLSICLIFSLIVSITLFISTKNLSQSIQESTSSNESISEESNYLTQSSSSTDANSAASSQSTSTLPQNIFIPNGDEQRTDETAEYIESYMELVNGKVKHSESYSWSGPGLTNVEVKNNGERTVTEVTVTVYFYDENHKAIAENSTLIMSSDSYLSDSRYTLKPNYSFRMADDKFYKIENLPSNVDITNYSIEITDISFKEN